MIISPKTAFTAKNFEKKLAGEKLSIFLLWLLSKREMHGYEIVKTIGNDHAIIPIAASKMYPLLKQLQKKGLITYRKAMQGKRERKVYSTTPAGRLVLKKAKEHIRKSPLVMGFVEDMLR